MFRNTHINLHFKKFINLLLCILLFTKLAFSQSDSFLLLQPDRVFDGVQMHDGWVVLVKNNLIEFAGITQAITIPSGTKRIDLKGMTLLPGLIEGHSHLFLHPYNEVKWNDQVLKESRAERTARAVTHAKATIMAGFTTVRDLGTEGCMYDDVGLKTAIVKGIIPGPRMIVSTRAIVAKGSYAPKSENPEVSYPQGAAEVASVAEMENEVRTQISKGADLIKVYADYRWGLNDERLPTLTQEEIATAVYLANSSGRPVAAHATSTEGMRRAILAGVSTIEHGDNGTAEIFKMMKDKGIGYSPTLSATEAYEQYDGWKKGHDPDPASVIQKKKAFRLALESGVTICMGGDVGVFTHGDNAREMELMVEYGMKPLDVLRSATSVNADVFGYANRIGRIKKGLFADLVAVGGDPSTDIKSIRNVKLVIKDGKIVFK